MMEIQAQAKRLNEDLCRLSTAEERIAFTLDFARSNGGKVVQTTSFGIQSALMLYLSRRVVSRDDVQKDRRVPVVWIDTGYLPPETYQFANSLTSMYEIDLHIYQSLYSPARMEALFGGKIWEDPSDDAHQRYNFVRKVEPMERALQTLEVTIVLTGLRSSQTDFRKQLSFAHAHIGRIKVCPILDWTDEQVSKFFQKHELPYHPLHAKGYRTVGDWHSSQPYDPTVHKSERDSRFHGRKQECGLHMSVSTVSLTETEESSSTLGFSPETEEGFVIYGRPTCKYCRAAKKLLQELSYQLSDESENFPQVYEVEVGKIISKETLEDRLGRVVKTVPQIVYKGKFIGGYDDLVDWSRDMYSEDALHRALDTIVIE